MYADGFVQGLDHAFEDRHLVRLHEMVILQRVLVKLRLMGSERESPVSRMHEGEVVQARLHRTVVLSEVVWCGHKEAARVANDA